MCGIAGFVGPGSLEDLQRMGAALHLRGPDAQGYWLDSNRGVGFAHTRLSVLDHAGGTQPMWTPDGEFGVVFNGEIYNFETIRRELTELGCVFQSDHSDTETLLLGYRQWGSGVVERLNGMWSFAIFDRARGQLFASRDRFGKKPFYYRQHTDGFVFASELSALAMHPRGKGEVDTLAIKKYFAYGYIPAPLTQYRDVLKLPAGHNLLLDIATNRCRVDRYWKFTLAPHQDVDEDEAADEARALIAQAVQRRLISDVPLGVFLSGGLDSSFITALAARQMKGGRLKTFSIGFDVASFDESTYAREVAAHVGAQHVEERLRMDDALALADTLGERMAEPIADSSILATYLVSHVARKHVTVVLGGDGADELFAGYGPFQALKFARVLCTVMPKAGIALLGRLANLMPVSHRYMSLDFKIKRALAGLRHPPPMWIPSWMAPVDVSAVNLLVDDGIAHQPEQIYSEALACWTACSQTDLVGKALEFFTTLYLQDSILAKVDRASMMNSLEVRAPFLDIDVANFAMRLPTPLKLRGLTTKHILKKAASPLLPASILNRRKQGFAVPIGRWFQQGALSPDMASLPGFMNASEVARRLQLHRAGRCDERLFLWAVLMLQSALAVPKL